MEVTTTPEVLPAPGTGNPILDRAVCVTVYLGAIGNRKKVPTTAIQVDADKALIGVSKQLLDSPELKLVQKIDSEIRGYLYRTCLPSMFRSGVYLLPLPLIRETQQKLEDFKERRKRAVEDFIVSYEQRKQEAGERLREVFNPMDYLPEARIRAAFTFDWQYVNFGTPGKLRQVSAEFFEQERRKAESKWAEATAEVQQVLRAAMADLVTHMVSKLTAGDDGKKRVFRNSTVTNLNEFLATFNARNVADDGELKSLVERARELLAGVDPDDLRKNEAVRDNVRQGFEALKGQLETMVVDRAARVIEFEDEEVAA